jgi:hypothetical protein
MNKPGAIDSSFTPHCPACGGTSWKFTDSDDSRECANPTCQNLHWFRNAPAAESPVATGRITYTETVEEYIVSEKRKRVRALVFAMLASQSIKTDAMVVVEYAIMIDESIERVK